jgi:arginase
MPGGLSWDELTTVLRAAAANPSALGIEVCIYNPSLDPEPTIRGRSQTRTDTF